MGTKYTPAGKALTDLILALFALNGKLLESGDELVRDLKQTSSRWQVFGVVADKSLTVSEIARKMGLTRQSVQRTVDRLVEEGVLELKANPNHARAPLVSLTKEGMTLYRVIAERQVRWANDLGKGFSTDDLTSCAESIAKLFQRLDQKLK